MDQTLELSPPLCNPLNSVFPGSGVPFCDQKESGARAQRGAPGARAARERLILTDGHIKTIQTETASESRFRSVPDAWKAKSLYSIKYFRLGGDRQEVVVARVHALPEHLGGLPRLRARGKREPSVCRSVANIERAAQRAKTKVRHIAKWISADRMLTFTTRECIVDRDRMAASWAKFCRLMTKASDGKRFDYVLTMEYQQRGAIHLHAAVSGFFPMQLAHRLWQIALGGRGSERGADTLGNVRVDRRSTRGAPRSSVSRIARYISKYLVKEFARDADFGKKRYWASRVDLEAPHAFYCTAGSADAAYSVFLEHVRGEGQPLNLLDDPVYRWASDYFLSRDGRVLWREGHGLPLPPPF